MSYRLLELTVLKFDEHLVTYIFSTFQQLCQPQRYWTQALVARFIVNHST